MRIRQLIKVLALPLFIVMIAACGGGGGGGDDSTASAEPTELKKASAGVEKAFASGEPQQLLDVMTDEAQDFYADGLNDFQPMMSGYAALFKTREIFYVSENYAEYVIDAGGDSLTVSFARKDDGSWKLMRF